MVAFAGRKYAARSLPAFVADNTHTVTSFTLVSLMLHGNLNSATNIKLSFFPHRWTLSSVLIQVLEFQKGTLQNLFWKKFGCDSCKGDSFVCLNKTDCAVANNKCNGNGGSIDCNVSIQLAFSGTDKNQNVLNSWYEVKNLRQYSLYGLFQHATDSLTSPFKNLF